MKQTFDIFIIGGGINGAGIIEMLLVGVKIILAEKIKWDLIPLHGLLNYSSGLRYLENYEFRFVKSLKNVK